MQRDCAVDVGDVLMELQAAGAARESNIVGDPPAAEAEKRLTVLLAHGLHARPAAVLSACAKRFASSITVHAKARKANAKSAVAIMSLGIRPGDEIRFHAAGSDAQQAVNALEESLAKLSAGAHGVAAEAVQANALESKPRKAAETGVARLLPPQPPMNGKARGISAQGDDLEATVCAGQGASSLIRAVIASRGLAVGYAVHLGRPELSVTEAGRGIAHETAELERARTEVRTRLRAIVDESTGPKREIIEAHLELIDDVSLTESAQTCIARNRSAGYAWRQATRETIEALRAAGDPRIAERVDDLLDLESQVLLALSPDSTQPGMRPFPERAILVANELLPSQLATLDVTNVAGICTAAGGPTSHVAILAAAMGIPALVAAGPAVLRVVEGAKLILDADHGCLKVEPASDQWAAAEKAVASQRARKAAEQAAAQRECRTRDGIRIEVFANVGSVADAKSAIAAGAEGCGLLRTEFLFLDRQSAPSEEEQAAQYQSIAQVFAPCPVVIRTLDIGGDKPIPYLPLPQEDNPALGLRGVRTSLWRLDLLRTQLQAVLRVELEQCRLLLPMITSLAELRAIRAVLDEVAASRGISATIPVGVMIETPASAVMADQLASEADFFSIGTNDLTQYTLAMDRGHPELAPQLDALHPAVLRLIASTCKAARAHNKPVAVCGGLASDPAAAAILIGLGVDELSAVPSMIPRLKALIGDLTMEDCRELAQRALEQETAEAVRALTAEKAAKAEV
jgi:phosphocarrier protein FPr/phosphocarrier protein